MAVAKSVGSSRLLRSLNSVRTGIILLILIAVASVVGTLVMQRPLTDPAEIERAYSPPTLRWLDAAGFTDVFHAPWFVALLALLCVNIALASLERFPNAWRYFSRPYLRPSPHFLFGLPMHQEVEVATAGAGLQASERALAAMGLKARRIGPREFSPNEVASRLVPSKNVEWSLYAERHRWARLAPYVVHASLLLILAGGIVDSIWGYRGFVALSKGETISEIELRDGSSKVLPFAVRCDEAGQENHPDGTPQRWWSQLAVLENGREVLRKEIAVNDPLVYGGLRFFQSSYGSTGDIGAIKVRARRRDDPASAREFALALGERVELDAHTTVEFAAFVPDFVVVNGRVETRSTEPNNPAIRLMVEEKKAGAVVASKAWLFPRFPNFSHAEQSPYAFEYQDMESSYYTGLQVAYEPGQWAVWAGAILMVVGLVMAFYMVHIRFWVVPLTDARGRTVLWVGASAAKNREEFEHRFRRLVEAIRQEVAKARHGPRSRGCAEPCKRVSFASKLAPRRERIL